MDIEIKDSSITARIQSEEITEIADYIGKIVPWFLKNWIWVLNDNIQYYRWVNRLKLLTKWIEKVKESWLSLQEVALKQFIPIIDNGSLEEDDSMQERRSNMLSNLTTHPNRVKNSYPEILKQLESIEVKVLDHYYESTKHLSNEEMINKWIWKDKAKIFFNISDDDYYIMADNLIRLRLLTMPSSGSWASIWDNPFSLYTYDTLQITALWKDFIKSIKFPN